MGIDNGVIEDSEDEFYDELTLPASGLRELGPTVDVPHPQEASASHSPQRLPEPPQGGDDIVEIDGQDLVTNRSVDGGAETRATSVCTTDQIQPPTPDANEAENLGTVSINHDQSRAPDTTERHDVTALVDIPPEMPLAPRRALRQRTERQLRPYTIESAIFRMQMGILDRSKNKRSHRPPPRLHDSSDSGASDQEVEEFARPEPVVTGDAHGSSASFSDVPVSQMQQSDPEDSDFSEPSDDELLNRMKRRVRGALPPSFITLEFMNQRSIQEESRRQQRKRRAETPHEKGVARRKLAKRLANTPMVQPPSNGQESQDVSTAAPISLPSPAEETPPPSDKGVDDEQNHTFEVIDVSSSSDIEEEDHIDQAIGQPGRTQPQLRGSSMETSRRNATRSKRTSRRDSAQQRKLTEYTRARRADRLQSSGRRNSRPARPRTGLASGRRSHPTSTSRKAGSRSTERQLNVIDAVDWMTQKGAAAIPDFMKIAKRSAQKRQQIVGDRVEKKVIHIEDLQQNMSEQNTLRRWRSGALFLGTKPSSRHVTTTSRRDRSAPTVRRTKTAAMSVRDSNDPSDKPSRPETVKERASRPRPRQSFPCRSFKTAILEQESGTFAIRHSSSTRGASLDKVLQMHQKHALASNVIPPSLPDATALRQREPRKPVVVRRLVDLDAYHVPDDEWAGEENHSDNAGEGMASVFKSLLSRIAYFRHNYDIEPFPSDLLWAPDGIVGSGLFDKILGGGPVANSTASIEDLSSKIKSWIVSATLGGPAATDHPDIYEVFTQLILTGCNAISAARLEDLDKCSLDVLELLQRAVNIHPDDDRLWESACLALEFLLILRFQLVKQAPPMQVSAFTSSFKAVGRFALQLMTNPIAFDVLIPAMKRMQSILGREVSSETPVIESLYVIIKVIDAADALVLGGGFHDLLVSVTMGIEDTSVPDVGAYEDYWRVAFMAAGFYKLRGFNADFHSRVWNTVNRMANSLFSVASVLHRDKYLALLFKAFMWRCRTLVHVWKWPVNTDLIVSFFRFFAARNYENLEPSSAVSPERFPSFLTADDASQSLLKYELSDTSFHVFLKWIASTLDYFKSRHDLRPMIKLAGHATPLNNRAYPRTDALQITALESLANQYALHLSLYTRGPSSALRLEPIRDFIALEDSHISARAVSIAAWHVLIAYTLRNETNRGHSSPFDICLDWLKRIVVGATQEVAALERIEAAVEPKERKRRLENTRMYSGFLSTLIKAVGDLIAHHNAYPDPDMWQSLLSEEFMGILVVDHDGSVTEPLLKTLEKYIDATTPKRLQPATTAWYDELCHVYSSFSIPDTSDPVESASNGFDTFSSDPFKDDDFEWELQRLQSRRAATHLRDVGLPAFFQVFSSSAGSKTLSQALAASSAQGIALQLSTRMEQMTRFYARLCTYLVEQQACTWLEFVHGTYSWRSIPDSEAVRALEPLWLSLVVDEALDSIGAEYFITQLMKYLVSPYEGFAARFVKSFDKVKDRLGVFAGVNFRADRFIVLKDLIGLLLKHTVMGSTEYGYLSAMLSEMKRNYLLHKADGRYTTFVEQTTSLIVESFEDFKDPSLEWFLDARNFELVSHSLPMAAARMKQHAKHGNSETLFFYVVHTLEDSVVKNGGTRFVSLVSDFARSYAVGDGHQNEALEEILAVYFLHASIDNRWTFILLPIVRAFAEIINASVENGISSSRGLEFVRIYLLQQVRNPMYELTSRVISLIFEVLAAALGRTESVGMFPVNAFVEIAGQLLEKIICGASERAPSDREDPRMLLNGQRHRSNAVAASLSRFRWDSGGHELVYQSKNEGTKRMPLTLVPGPSHNAADSLIYFICIALKRLDHVGGMDSSLLDYLVGVITRHSQHTSIMSLMDLPGHQATIVDDFVI